MAKYSDKRKTPCRECPFTKRSLPGYLGSDDPEHFVLMATGDTDLPCHMEIDYSDPEWRETQETDAPLCAGRLLYLNNYQKLARDPDIAQAQRQVASSDDKIFSSPEEFLIHHKVGTHRGPTEPHFLYRAHTVDLATGHTDIARIETYYYDYDGPSIYLAYDKTGLIIENAEVPDGTKPPEWVRHHGGIGGPIVTTEVKPEEYEQIKREWVQ